MSIPIWSMSAMRCSAETLCRSVRTAFCRLISRLCGLAWVSRYQRATLSLPSTISVALVLRMWQWMSSVNHLPRACAGPGKCPGIGVPDFSNPAGRQVNSIASSPALRHGCQPVDTGGADPGEPGQAPARREHALLEADPGDQLLDRLVEPEMRNVVGRDVHHPGARLGPSAVQRFEPEPVLPVAARQQRADCPLLLGGAVDLDQVIGFDIDRVRPVAVDKRLKMAHAEIDRDNAGAAEDGHGVEPAAGQAAR